jgi:hypothetical protein
MRAEILRFEDPMIEEDRRMPFFTRSDVGVGCGDPEKLLSDNGS